MEYNNLCNDLIKEKIALKEKIRKNANQHINELDICIQKLDKQIHSIYSV